MGFSLIEVLVCLLIIGSGFLTCSQLLARIQFVQFQSNQSLKALLMLDYAASQLAIATEACNSANQSQKKCYRHSPQGVSRLFDSSFSLLDGYVELDPVKTSTYRGCISYLSDKTYIVGVIERGSAIAKQICTASNFQWVTKYRTP